MYIFVVNAVPVLLGTLAAVLLGMLWYGPLFGKMWKQLSGISLEETPHTKKQEQLSSLYITLLTLLMSYILTVFFRNLLVISIQQALLIPALIWIGFIAPITSKEYIMNKSKPWKLYFINSGYVLLSLLIMGLINFWLR